MRTVVNPIAVALALAAPAHAAPFAPYVDEAGYPPPALAAMAKAAGVKRVTLGFVTARDGTACEPTWGGYATYPAGGAAPYQLAEVRKLRRQGRDAIVSFGGQAGAELATVCPDAESTLAAYEAVVQAYGATRLDFDIEGGAVADEDANIRRARAIAALRSRHPKLAVDATVPVLPSGLDAPTRQLFGVFAAAGTRLDLVNVMAMDYGDAAAPHPQGRMGTYAIRAVRNAARQLKRPLSRMAATPMIGVNDVPSEVFTVRDARQLRRWAGAHHLGGLRMWRLERDKQSRWAFSRALR